MIKILASLFALGACATANADSVTYVIDPTHTFVTFEADHFGTSTLRGRFDRKEGTVRLDRAAKTGHVVVSFDTASVDTGVSALDVHLKSADFFNTSRWAKAEFIGDSFRFDGDKVSAVAGTLTLLGKPLPLTLQATRFNCYLNPLLKREVCGGDFEASIARSRWGMGHGLDEGLPDTIRLLIQVEAIKQ